MGRLKPRSKSKARRRERLRIENEGFALELAVLRTNGKLIPYMLTRHHGGYFHKGDIVYVKHQRTSFDIEAHYLLVSFATNPPRWKRVGIGIL